MKSFEICFIIAILFGFGSAQVINIGGCPTASAISNLNVTQVTITRNS